jgi:thymidylate synthase (FAD)
MPPSVVRAGQEAVTVYSEFMHKSQVTYNKLVELGVPKEDSRLVLVNACESEIVISANFREFRHIFKERCQLAAQWEIRDIACLMLQALLNEAYSAFGDFEIKFNDRGEMYAVSPYAK